MITRISGTLNRVLDEEVRLQVGAFEYQVLIPEFIRRQLQTHTGETVTFSTIEYIEGNQASNKMIPRIIGFLQESELDFFDLFCTVDKIGTKKALKAMARPIREIANAIARQDAKWLTSLPGIGKSSADQIIATLKDKVTRYSLLPEVSLAEGNTTTPAAPIEATVLEDAYLALMSLGMSSLDARTRLDVLLTTGQKFENVQEVINLVFKAAR